MIVILDFDGTVADTMPSLTLAATHVITERYYLEPTVARARYLETVGDPFMHQLEAMFPGDARNPACHERFLELQAAVYKGCQLHPTAQNAIELLLDAGDDVAIVSSSLRVLTCQVLARELPRLATEIELRGYEDGTKFTQVRELTNGGRLSATLIGDAPSDQVVARLAGVRFIGVEHTFPMGDFDGARVAPDLLQAVQELVG